MTARRSTIVVAVLAAIAIGGCGGDDEGTRTRPQASSEPRGQAPPALLARANANCRRFLRQARELGKGAFSEGSGTILERATEQVIKPGIPLIEDMARRQQALARAGRDPALSLYADLFDPIVVLAQERLRSGRAAIRIGNELERERSGELEDLMTDLGNEQMAVARGAGLRDCSVDFRKALVSALTG
jgi:hypothetical protein